MGKIRIKTLGIEEIEKEQTQEAKKRKEAKKEKKLAKGAHGADERSDGARLPRTVRDPAAAGLDKRGRGRVVSMAPTEEELAQIEVPTTPEVSEVPPIRQAQGKQVSKISKARQRSKRYRDALIQVDRSRNYSLSEAIELLKRIGASHFDGTVELHVNTTEKGVSGQVTLPHGSGKTVRVAIADPSSDGKFDTLVSKIEQGKIDFDVLIAHPSAMPQLAKVAKILGPRGLMPNPKSGTISDTPTKLLEKFQGGQVNFRTESQAPIIHATVGKVSFKEKALSENIAEFLKAVGVSKIRSVTLKSTMSPGIKIDFSSLS